MTQVSGASLQASRRAFTLIELLVVIGIIAILLAILFPVVQSSINKGNKAKAQSEMAHIVSAIRTYYGEYALLPVMPGANGNADLTYGLNQNRIINLLRGIDTTNGKGRVFLEVDIDSIQADGTYLDPWGNAYIICMDTDFDNLTEFTGLSVPPAPVVSLSVTSVIAAVVSYGPDPTDSKSFLSTMGSN
jgi:prepilin-type N-terminal cleavage/methylation domain-containing protein